MSLQDRFDAQDAAFAASKQHEFTEAQSEIRRHHADFAAISEILDIEDLSDSEKVRRIRNIVG